MTDASRSALPPALEVRGVTKTFGDRTALAGLDLDLARGELVGFVGPNGAGKSTLLRILVGVLRRDGGDVRVLGMDPQRRSLAIRRRSSYLPGETNVYDQMTGADYLQFADSFHQRLRGEPRGIAEAFDVPLRARVRSYSAGMKQKLAIRAALRPDVDLYILDEPDRALDASVRLALRDWLRLLRNDGRAVLLSSHHLAEVEALADRCCFVFGGRNVAPERVAAARRELRREVRMRLSGDTVALPDGATVRERLPDGSLRITVHDGEPLQWLARLPADAVLAVEVGATRLEDVYRALQERGALAVATAEGRP
ncbi:MAG: ABC transporter ATP-binding protein [Planctomycetes bacterium]|nr:ABC transporter ATP-binding protein [Planctomycetota bacterium]